MTMSPILTKTDVFTARNIHKTDTFLNGRFRIRIHIPVHRYGFDERPQNADWAHGINQMFGAIKRAFPGLRTAAALRWRAETVNNVSVLQLGDSLDIWVQLYRHRLYDRFLLLIILLNTLHISTFELDCRLIR